jgi:hypothetical protein
MVVKGIGPKERNLTEPEVFDETDGVLANGIPLTKAILGSLLDHLPEKLLAVQPLEMKARFHVVDELPGSGSKGRS